MYSGRKLKIYLDGTLIAACRTKSVSFSRQSIDETDGEDNGWRFLNETPDMRAVTVSVQGIATAANFRLLDEFFQSGDELPSFRAVFPSGGELIPEDGAFLSQLDYTGEVLGGVIFSATFLLAGSVSVSVEPDPEPVLVAVGTSAAAFSLDNGDSWTEASSPPVNTAGGSFNEGDCRALCYDSTRERWVAAGAHQSSWISSDNGDTWVEFADAFSPVQAGHVVDLLYIASADIVLAGISGNTNNRVFYYSTDGGESFSALSVGTVNEEVCAMMIDTVYDRVVATASADSPTSRTPYVFTCPLDELTLPGSWSVAELNLFSTWRWHTGDGLRRGLDYHPGSDVFVAGEFQGSSLAAGRATVSAVGGAVTSNWASQAVTSSNGVESVGTAYFSVDGFIYWLGLIGASDGLARSSDPSSGFSSPAGHDAPISGNNRFLRAIPAVGRLFLGGNGNIAHSANGVNWTNVTGLGTYYDLKCSIDT